MERRCKQWATGVAVLCLVTAAFLSGIAWPQSKMEIHADDFTSGAPIPPIYACTGRDISPPLSWSGVPKRAKTLALIVDDPDAPDGVFFHWIVYNLDPATTHIAEHVKKNTTVPLNGQQGRNDFGRYGYSGPCPPPGPLHHYRFRLFALDNHITPEPPTGPAVEHAIAGHIVSATQLVGTYGR
jgi:Raf kinase inhibitor-like YbhB/YbcL family protein